jgi:hypothetical protein
MSSIAAKMGTMHKSRRQQNITDLAKLDDTDFDSVMREVGEKRNTEKAGANYLRQLFEGREARARSLTAGIFGGQEQE